MLLCLLVNNLLLLRTVVQLSLLLDLITIFLIYFQLLSGHRAILHHFFVLLLPVPFPQNQVTNKSTTVVCVIEYRMPCILQMHPDLVGSARFRLALQ